MLPMRVLLVNPAIYDFTAYDFWLRPYGLLRVAGRMRGCCRFDFFNYLVADRRDDWGRGPFPSLKIPKPRALEDIPRHFRRFGRPRSEFRELLKARRYEAVLIQTAMTYWYPGVLEAIEDIRECQPSAKIVIGGVYTTLCPAHARSLGADLVIEGADLDPLWKLLSVEPSNERPYWPTECSNVGVLKLTEGCPFRCTYCSAFRLWPEFAARPLSDCLDELAALHEMGATDIAFYDDALLHQADRILVPFLKGALDRGISLRFHTPNALNARFVDGKLARAMVQAGFTSFFLGLESIDPSWQCSTGGKVAADEFRAAVQHLRTAGASSITTYIILGHPDSDGQDLERSMRFARDCGTRILLSEFSPVPGAPDSLSCEPWADLNEPLSHNKTAFALRRLGPERVNRLKDLNRSLNASITGGRIRTG